MTLKSKYLSGAHTFARFLDVFDNQRFLIMFRSCMVRHIAFIVSVCDRFCDSCTHQNNYFQDKWKPFFWSSTPSKTWIAQSRAVCQRSGHNSFRNVHRDNNEICIVLLFHALFCLVLCVPAVTRQVATHCPLLVRKRHCFPETVGLVVAAVLYATVPLRILCAVPFLCGRGYSWWACSSVPSCYLLSWVENDFINRFI